MTANKVAKKRIYCCGCTKKVKARLTDGKEVYPHRTDLAVLPFWHCDTCTNFVGCHHKTKTPTRPLGCIPTPEMKNARRHIHTLIDPLWKGGAVSRSELYDLIGKQLGRTYHTAALRTLDEAREVYRIGLKLRKALLDNNKQI